MSSTHFMSSTQVKQHAKEKSVEPSTESLKNIKLVAKSASVNQNMLIINYYLFRVDK